MTATKSYGLLAEFSDATALTRAAHRVTEAGYTRTDAFAPFPVEGLSDGLGFHRTFLSWAIFLGGVGGAVGGYMLQWYFLVYSYPQVTGGKPHHSWQTFMVPTFECTILGAALTAVFGMFVFNGLPLLYHPVFNVPRFGGASDDRFFLVVESRDPKYDAAATATMLHALGATEVSEVPY